MFLVLDAQNPANWEPKWTFDIPANKPTSGTWDPIPEQTCPVICHSPVLGIFAQAPEKKPHWAWAGVLKQSISTGLVVGGTMAVQAGTIRDIYLDALRIVTFENLQVADYALTFKPAFWHTRMIFTAWEYVGPLTTDTKEAITQTNQLLVTGFTSTATKLQLIDQKIDSAL